MPPTEEAAMRRAGAHLALAAASALALFPAAAAVGSRYVVLVLALFVAFDLGCAAVLFSPARRAVAQGASEILAAPWRAATWPRWVGFSGMVFYAAYAAGHAREDPPAAAAAAEVSVDMVYGLLPFLAFLVGVLTVNLSVLTGRASEPAPPPAMPAAAAEEQLDGGEVNVVLLASACDDNSKV